MTRSQGLCVAVLLEALLGCTQEEEQPLPLAVLEFEEVARQAGLRLTYEPSSEVLTALANLGEPRFVELRERLGGIAMGDIDADGWVDLVVLGGSNETQVYFGREGGAFELQSSASLRLDPGALAPLLLDLTGDGRPELVVPSAVGNGLQIFENRWPKAWRELTQQWGLGAVAPSLSCAAADVDGDDHLDLLLGRWGATHAVSGLMNEPLRGLLWVNDSGKRFEDRTDWLELPLIERAPGELLESVIAPRFADVDNDGDTDLWLTADFGATLLLRQVDSSSERADAGESPDAAVPERDAASAAPADARAFDAGGDAGGLDGGKRWRSDAAFGSLDGGRELRALWGRGALTARGWTGASAPRFRAEHGEALAAATNASGAAIGDFDNDGDLDWFISGIGAAAGMAAQFSGSRLLQNDGFGNFQDVTQGSGLIPEGWGRDSCMEDFDNDGRLDIAQLSGETGNASDRLRLFIASRKERGVFIEVAAAAGIADAGQGRSLICVDYDQDGDVDLIVGDADGGVRLFQNRLDPERAFGANYFGVRLVGKAPNTAAVGARVSVRVGTTRQLREIQAASGLVSHAVSALHFGVGTARHLDELVITWPDGEEQAVGGLATNDLVVIRQPD